ncbi:MAG: serine/threonine protein kinase [Planctomycetes bacterium]|nr:serine/threonine protein kinase [Planctomycetota bacterium]
MTVSSDVEFLALLVHRGRLDRAQAEALMARMQKGGAVLDRLLESELGWSAEKVEGLRRTKAGAVPEIPGYEILQELGHGGTADVFRAREKKTGRTLALKVLKPESAEQPKMLASFVREANLLKSLEHPGLVKGFGPAKFVPKEGPEIYFAKLECIEGETLLELLDKGQEFQEEVALKLILAVAEVLSYLSSKDLVHRDVKPGNVMLDHNGRVKLIDLGFAADQGAKTSQEGSATGTVAYLSPEEARGGAQADLRSDVYSLGVTLFQVAVGRLPFQSSNDEDLLRKQVQEALNAPELKGRGFSPHLSYFIQKMMAKEADVRYQSWEELLEDIREQLKGREKLDFTKGEAAAPRQAPRPRRRF